MKPILWKEHYATLIDQTKLPLQEVWTECHSLEDFADAIRSMKIRGAPAIGITAAYGLAAVTFNRFCGWLEYRIGLPRSR